MGARVRERGQACTSRALLRQSDRYISRADQWVVAGSSSLLQGSWHRFGGAGAEVSGPDTRRDVPAGFLCSGASALEERDGGPPDRIAVRAWLSDSSRFHL